MERLAHGSLEIEGVMCLDEGMVAYRSVRQRPMTPGRLEALACRAFAAQLD